MDLSNKHQAQAGRRPVVMALAAVLILSAITVIVSLHLAPSMITQGRDNGIFSYTSWVIREGGLLYRDAWDNKPPIVYYLSALVFWLLGTNRWAIWWQEVVMVTLAVITLYFLLWRVFGRRLLVWIGVAIFLLLVRHPSFVWDVNFSELTALWPQLMCFWLGYALLRQPRYRAAFGLGLFAAAAFLIKQTTIGVALMFIPALLIGLHPAVRDPRRWRLLGTIIAGGLLGLAVPVVYFLAVGILDDAYRASFVHATIFHEWVGLIYPDQQTFGDSLRLTLTKSAYAHLVGPLLPFVITGLVAAVWQPIEAARGMANRDRSAATFGLWAALTFAADTALANLTGRAYEHYYVTMMPALTVLLVLNFQALLRAWGWIVNRWRAARVVPSRGAVRGRVVGYGAASVLLAIWIAVAFVYVPVGIGAKWGQVWTDRLRTHDINGPVLDLPISRWIADHTRPGDRVLVWGATTSINFQSRRYSPTQYHYAYPLIVPGYTTDDMLREVVCDLDANHTAVVLDRALLDGNRVPPLDLESRARWIQRGGRADALMPDLIYEWVLAHCDPPVVFRDAGYAYLCNDARAGS